MRVTEVRCHVLLDPAYEARLGGQNMEHGEAVSASERSAPWSLRGVLPVFQTPFRENEEIDPGALATEIDWLFENGSDGVVMGLVSEVARLSSEEQDTLCTLACRFADSRAPVIASVGAESSHQAVMHAAAGVPVRSAVPAARSSRRHRQATPTAG